MDRCTVLDTDKVIYELRTFESHKPIFTFFDNLYNKKMQIVHENGYYIFLIEQADGTYEKTSAVPEEIIKFISKKI